LGFLVNSQQLIDFSIDWILWLPACKKDFYEFDIEGLAHIDFEFVVVFPVLFAEFVGLLETDGRLSHVTDVLE